MMENANSFYDSTAVDETSGEKTRPPTRLIRWNPAKTTDDLEIDLPKCLFTFIPLQELNFSKAELPMYFPGVVCSSGGFCEWLLLFFYQLTSSWMVLLFVLTVQSAFIVYLYFLLQEPVSVDTCPTHGLLRLVAIFSFSSNIFADLKETIEISAFFLYFPSSSNVCGNVDLKDDEDGGNNSTLSDNLMFRARDFDAEDQVMLNPAKEFSKVYRMPLRTKILTLLFSIIPKIAIACSLWYFGCQFLQKSVDDGNLILNTVGLLFILDIDDMLYKTLISSNAEKFVFNYLPALTVKEEEMGCCCSCLFGFYAFFSIQVSTGVIIGASIVAWLKINSNCN